MNFDLIEIKLRDGVSEKIVIETLSRMGIASKKEKILWPSCYIVKREEKMFIGHFKQLFLMREDGYNNISEQDLERRNSIVFCLWNWGLIDVDEELIKPHDIFVFCLPYDQKKDWIINHKIKVNGR